MQLLDIVMIFLLWRALHQQIYVLNNGKHRRSVDVYPTLALSHITADAILVRWTDHVMWYLHISRVITYHIKWYYTPAEIIVSCRYIHNSLIIT